MKKTLNIGELISKKEGLEAQLKTAGPPEETRRIEEQLNHVNSQIHELQGNLRSDYQMHDELTEKALKPVNKVSSRLDKELQKWEVESTEDGQDSQGNG